MIQDTVVLVQFIQLYPPDERNLLARPISLSSISKERVNEIFTFGQDIYCTY